MVTALVRHLCQQGKYGPGEIAVLTPYVGQLRMLRNVLEKEMTLIISETDSDVLDETEGLEVSGTSTAHAKWCGKQRAPQKGSLLDVVRLATVDNFQVGDNQNLQIIGLTLFLPGRRSKCRYCLPCSQQQIPKLWVSEDAKQDQRTAQASIIQGWYSLYEC